MFKLNAEKREQKSTLVRAEGKIPAVVYGAGLQTESISLSLKEFGKIYDEAGESSLVDLVLDGKDYGNVLIYQVDYEPVKDRIIHVDLKKVDMNKVITATVKLVFIGEVPAVKELGGTLLRNTEEIEVECLPKDLVNHLDVDLTVLKTFDDTIKIVDLKLPAGVKLVEIQNDQIVAKVAPPLTEEQLKAMEEVSAPVDLSKIETDDKKEEDKDAEVTEVIDEKK
ncbi:MAG: 50S ribosomal protein L25 [Candidatus Magasanikbacteria bacterium]|nr:50S ribosomal protein L25 [Candidatus Magasanikbacteria bacterium]